jgi:hypothetical protein
MLRADRRMMIASGLLMLAAGAVTFLPWRNRLGGEQNLERALAAQGDASWNVAVIFQMRDCRERIESLRVWNELSGRAGLAVSGFVLGPDVPEDLQRAMADWGIEIPVRPLELSASALRALRGAGFRWTPMLVVQDPSGRIRAIASLDHLSSVEEARTFVENLVPTS